MSEAATKKKIREHFGNRCVDCEMTNGEHVKETGRSLDIHRLVEGSAYTVEGCALLCKWCHRYRHGAKGVNVKGTGRIPRGNTPIVQFRLTAEDLGYLREIAEYLHEEFGLLPTKTAALTYAIHQYSKEIANADHSASGG